jgi:hypothetical protein
MPWGTTVAAEVVIGNKKGAKRPPARLSGLTPSLTLMVLCTFYHAGVRNVTLVSQTFILRERKNYLKKREFGGGAGVPQLGVSNEIPFSTGIFPPPPLVP